MGRVEDELVKKVILSHAATMTIARSHIAIAALGIVLSPTRRAGAQVHWDAGIQAGATQRLTSGDAAAPKPTPGPSAEVHAHVAVFPMLRVGPYAAFDLSPAAGTNGRQVYAAGLRAKVTPPWLSAPWHAWAFVGVGFADAYTPRYRSSADLVTEGHSTGMLELPLGVGVARKLRGAWEIYAELAARIVAARASIGAPASGPARDDLLAVSLSLGVSFAQ